MADTGQRFPPGPTPGAVTLDNATSGVPYVVDRVPEEDAQLLQFLAGARLVPGRRMTLMEAMPYLGVMQVETEVDSISIGYNVGAADTGSTGRYGMTIRLSR